MNRRSLIITGLAGLAAAGLGWGVRRMAMPLPEPADGSSAAWLFDLSLPGPDGKPRALRDQAGKTVLVNFWATWCPPCIEEMPDLDAARMARPDGRFEVLGLAVDTEASVRNFLASNRVSYPIRLAGAGGTELARRLGNPAGALPFSVLIDADGRIVERKLGKIAPAELEGWLVARGHPRA